MITAESATPTETAKPTAETETGRDPDAGSDTDADRSRVVVGQRGGKWPGQTGRPRPPEIRADGSLPQPKRDGDRPLGHPLSILQP